MFPFFFISIHIAAAVVASRDSEEGKGGVPNTIIRPNRPTKKKKRPKPRPTEGYSGKCLTNFTTENNLSKGKKKKIGNKNGL